MTSDLKPSDTPSWNSGGTAHLLPLERAKATFDVEVMTNFLDGGKKETFRRRWITGSTKRDPDAPAEPASASKFDLARGGAHGGVAKNFEHFMSIHKEYLDKFFVPEGNDMLYMAMGTTMGGYPGFGLFLTTLLTQCSPEQLSWWLPKAYSMAITGSYAQTELGHGSNVRGLETIAEFDTKTKEFVLNTPTLTSMKWWPSNLASSTHCVLYAQLILNGVEHGLHVFFVQVRDEKLRPLPGVEVGDIGTKAGENEIDIGYLRLKNVRIPRKHMFERKAHVEPDGTYVLHSTGNGSEGSGEDDKSHYLTMMTARVQLVATSSVFLAKGATIAIRYNCVRKQGFKSSGDQSYKTEENPIVDYKVNQYILFKNLSLAFAIRTTSNWLTNKMQSLQKEVTSSASGIAVGGAAAATGAIIQELHASAAGLKGFCCNEVSIGLEELRKTCGGAAYLQASGIASLVADYKWRATAEGDTSVMLLQTARYLLKIAQNPDFPGSGPIHLLHKKGFILEEHKPKSCTTFKEYIDLDFLVSLLEFRTQVQVLQLKQTLEKKMKKLGLSYDQAWTQLTLKAVRTGETYVVYFLLSKFKEMVEKCEDEACRRVLYNLCALFGLSSILDGRIQSWSGVADLDGEQIELLETAIDKVCETLRPNCVALVDSWDFHDQSLNSTIGRYDGNVYEAQYEAAKNSPLNKEIVPSFFSAYEKFLDFNFLKLRNGLCEPNMDPDDCSTYPSRPKLAKL